MKKSLLLSVSLAALSTSAMSADFSVRPARPATPVAKPYSWSGFYGGAHIGYGWGNESDNQRSLFPAVQPTAGPTVAPEPTPTVAPTVTPTPTVAPTPTPPPVPTTTSTPIQPPDDFIVSIFKPLQDSSGGTSLSSRLANDRLEPQGFVGGLHLGYNYQIDQFVLGVEGDLDYSGIQDSNYFSYDTINGPVSGKFKLRSNWRGSARVRAGYAIDSFLLYITGGVAFADASLLTNGVGPSNTHIGWTVGGGIEYAFTENWIARVEARYTDFEKKTYQTSLGPVRAKWDETTATLGISYKF